MREASFSRGDILAAFIALVGACLLSFAAWKFFGIHEVFRSGVRVDAIIVRHEVMRGNSGGTGYHKAYVPVVRFSVDSVVYEGKANLAVGRELLLENDEVSVYYSRSNPENFVIDNFIYAYGESVIFVFFGVFLFAIGKSGLLRVAGSLLHK